MASDIGFSDGYICITGSDADDAVDVFVDGDQVMVSAAEYSTDGELVSSTSESFPVEGVRGIFFRGGAGDDTFVNDTNLRTIAMGGSGDDVLVGGSHRGLLHGGRGDDVLLGSHDIMMGGAGQNSLVLVDPISDDVAALPESAVESDPPADDELSEPVVDDSGTDNTQEDVVDDIVVDEIITVDIIDGDTDSQDDACPGDTDDTTLVENTDADVQDSSAVAEETDDVPVDEYDPPVEVQQDATSTPHFGITFTSSFTMLADEMGSWANAWLQSTASAAIGTGVGIPTDVYGPQLKESDDTTAWCVAEDEPLPPETLPDVDVEPETPPVVEDEVPVTEPICLPTDIVAVQEADTTGDTAVEQLDTVPMPETPVSYDDWLIGDEGRDLVFGGPGDDVIFGDHIPDDLLDLLLAEYLPGGTAGQVVA